MVVIKEAAPALRQLYGVNFTDEVENFSEIIGYSVEWDGEEFRVEFNPDRPDLFSFNLLKRAISVYHRQEGWHTIRIQKGERDYSIEDGVRKLRPFMIGFHCTGKKIGAHFKELIDYQEKLHLTVGKDRSKISIGLHDGSSLEYPLSFRSRNSREVSFTTYDGTVTGTAEEVLKKHPKGVEYSRLLPPGKLVPIIEDSKHRVLSMPPVVNGNFTTVSEDTRSFFVDITGTDLKAMKESFFLISYYFQALGYTITEANLDDIRENLSFDGRRISVSMDEVNRFLGQPLEAGDCASYLAGMGYEASDNGKEIKVKVPGNRVDVMGPADIIEDIAKAFGYGNLYVRMPSLDIVGAENPANRMNSSVRNIMTGLGYQEIMTYVVSTRDHYRNAEYRGGIHIRNPKSLDFSVVRDRLYLGALDFLRLNKRRNLPQTVFEVGEVIRDTEEITNLCAVKINSRSTFSDMKQVLDSLMVRLSLEDYGIVETPRENFIPGRVGTIVARGREIGYLGEIHPETLEQYELKNPVALLEVNLSAVSKLLR